jgi:methanogenic corrinoid protein MtbC1
MKPIIKEFHAAVMEGSSGMAPEKKQTALTVGLPAVEAFDGMIAVMAEVGNLFEGAEYFAPEMLISTGGIR